MTDAEDLTIEVPNDAAAPAIARQFVRDHSDHLPPELIADAALLVTELVTNAVRYGRPRITVRITLDPPRLGVLVRDEGADLPPREPVQPPMESAAGRGLVIVDRVSSDWGVVPAITSSGKTVWFELVASRYE